MILRFVALTHNIELTTSIFDIINILKSFGTFEGNSILMDVGLIKTLKNIINIEHNVPKFDNLPIKEDITTVGVYSGQKKWNEFFYI